MQNAKSIDYVFRFYLIDIEIIFYNDEYQIHDSMFIKL